MADHRSAGSCNHDDDDDDDEDHFTSDNHNEKDFGRVSVRVNDQQTKYLSESSFALLPPHGHAHGVNARLSGNCRKS